MKKNIIISDTYIINSLEESKFSLQAKAFGFEKCKSTRKPSIKKQYGYSIHYVLSGCGFIQYPNCPIIKIHSGEFFFLLPCSQEVRYYPDKNNPWVYIWIDYTGNNIPTMLQLLNITPSTPSIKASNKSKMYNMSLKMIVDCTKDTLSTTFICTYYCYCFFSHLLIHTDLSHRKKINSDSTIIKAQTYIENNYSNPELRISDVSEYVALNKVYFSRLFIKETGLSFSVYLMNLRIMKATNKFKAGNHSIKDVAYEVGFSSPYYFSKVFKKYHTISPKTYISQLQ